MFYKLSCSMVVSTTLAVLLTTTNWRRTHQSLRIAPVWCLTKVINR